MSNYTKIKLVDVAGDGENQSTQEKKLQEVSYTKKVAGSLRVNYSSQRGKSRAIPIIVKTRRVLVPESSLREKLKEEDSQKENNIKPEESIISEEKNELRENFDSLEKFTKPTENAISESEKKRSKLIKKKDDHFVSKNNHNKKSLKKKTDEKNIYFTKENDLNTKTSLKENLHSEIKDQGFQKPIVPIVKKIVISGSITVRELAHNLAMTPTTLVTKLMKMVGGISSINQTLDRDTTILVIEELGHKAILLDENEERNPLLKNIINAVGQEIKKRSPIVTIMGHVDHGKTTLLDYIRSSRLVTREVGGITQSIGAYHVKSSKGIITFLDTPGHELFSTMRLRGSQITDIIVLVVAADDGIMPQTIEAIQHTRIAKVPIIVAINKIDKSRDFEKIKAELGNYDIVLEEWGGDDMIVYLSAKTGEGIDNLLDVISLQAELLDLKVPFDTPAIGVIIEARLQKGLGITSSILVQRGTLKRGDLLLTGSVYGKVKAIFDEYGKRIEKVQPSIPAEIIGLSLLPKSGDQFVVVNNDKEAKEIVALRKMKLHRSVDKPSEESIEEVFAKRDKEEFVLNIIIKTDVKGSQEVLTDGLLRLTRENIKINIISSGIGAINQSDINLALISKAIIVGFNVIITTDAKKLVTNLDVKIFCHKIIYEIIEYVKEVIGGSLKPRVEEQKIGLLEIRRVFRSSKFISIAGCKVIWGMIHRNRDVKLLRENRVIFEGKIASIKHQKDEISEVNQGMECGVALKDFNDIKISDHIEVFEKIKVKDEIKW